MERRASAQRDNKRSKDGSGHQRDHPHAMHRLRADEPGEPFVLRDDQQFYEDGGRQQSDGGKKPKRKRAGLGGGVSETKRQQKRWQGERKSVDKLQIETHCPGGYGDIWSRS